MIKRLNWFGKREGEEEWFPVCVPGNIQKDYAAHCGLGDLNYADNCKRYETIEDDVWYYRAEFVEDCKGKRCFFVTGGIDYRWDLILNGEVLVEYEGMFSAYEQDITDRLRDGKNELTVKIYPHPKRADAPVSRDQADRSCKYPASYGWDWHPRILPSGIWNDAYLELRGEGFIRDCEVSYTLADDYSKADVSFSVDFDGDAVFCELYDDCGNAIYRGADRHVTLENPKLWWCNGQGEPTLYTWRVHTATHEKTGKIGFRRVELRMNEGAWLEPKNFPKSRSCPPITLTLNGRKIFAKGSNIVSPDVFFGPLTYDRYRELVTLAKDANMNILRVWGGSGVYKDDFFNLCDEMGIMLWQEFPLACNAYVGEPNYMRVLEQEGRSIVRRLRRHPSVVLWCGGNELFNKWSMMTDQSFPLRLLNKICLEEDPYTPFIATSPLMGMAHGCYVFYEHASRQEVYQMFNNAHATAYTEFGVPSIPSPEYLKTFIPEEELYPPREGTSWETHHAFGAWHEDTWLCLSVIEKYFGKQNSLEEIYEKSTWLQCEGYKAIFEEARRQKPYCSMAINWCYNEPWKTAANNSLISYPALPKPAYYTVANSLRNVLPSARLDRFSYADGDLFSAELWLLNDSNETVRDTVHVSVEIGGERVNLMDWITPESSIGANVQGHTVKYLLPKINGINHFTLILESDHYGKSEYKLCYHLTPEKKSAKKILNV